MIMQFFKRTKSQTICTVVNYIQFSKTKMADVVTLLFPWKPVKLYRWCMVWCIITCLL